MEKDACLDYMESLTSAKSRYQRHSELKANNFPSSPICRLFAPENYFFQYAKRHKYNNEKV